MLSYSDEKTEAQRGKIIIQGPGRWFRTKHVFQTKIFMKTYPGRIFMFDNHIGEKKMSEATYKLFCKILIETAMVFL